MKAAMGLLAAAGLAVAGCGTTSNSVKPAGSGAGAPAASAIPAANQIAASASRSLAPAVVVDQAPPMDGTLSSPIWQKCPPLVLGMIASPDAGLLQTTAHILLDKQNLYIGWLCVEKNTASLVAKATSRDGEVWTDDSFEVYVSPDGEKAYHFAVNSKGVLLDGKSMLGERSDNSWNSGATAKTTVDKDKCWSGTLCIPLKDLAPKSGAGQTWKLNLNRSKPAGDGETFTESSWSAAGLHRYRDASGWGKLTGVNIP